MFLMLQFCIRIPKAMPSDVVIGMHPLGAVSHMQAVFQHDLKDRIRGNFGLSTFNILVGPPGGLLIIQTSNQDII